MDDINAFGGWMEGNGSSWTTNKLTETRKDNWHITTQVLANYMRSFGKHDLTLMAGFENYVLSSEDLTAGRDQYELINYPYLNVGPEDYKDNSGTGTRYTSNSFSDVCFILSTTAIFFRQTSAATALHVSPGNTAGEHSRLSPPAG